MKCQNPLTSLESLLATAMASGGNPPDEIFESEKSALLYRPCTLADAAVVVAVSMNNLLADQDPRLQELALSAQKGVIEYLGGVQGLGIAAYYGVKAHIELIDKTRGIARVG